MVRRLDRRALVLAPTATIAAQWADKLSLFTDDSGAFLAPRGPLSVLTYQAICQTSDPGGALRTAAEEHLVQERAAATGSATADVRAEIAALTGLARERFERDVSAEIARATRAAVRGDASALAVGALLWATARARLDELVAAGIGTLVLDECHHLASLWGYLIRAAISELPDVHVVGLTATSPSELSGDDAELYASILGPVDFQIPTPAVVRDGHLAPYQELAYFTTPLHSERAWLDERHVRFAELTDRLQEPAEAGEEDIASSPWPHPGEAAERRLAELQTGLRDLGFVLTRQGVRRGGSDVDRVLTSSAAKPLGAIEVLAAEARRCAVRSARQLPQSRMTSPS